MNFAVCDRRVMSRRRLASLVALALLAALLFVVDLHNELRPPSMYLIVHRPLGLSILGGKAYTSTYPLWGYPLLIAAIGRLSTSWVDDLLPALQLVLTWVVVVAFVWRWLARWRLPVVLGFLFVALPILSFADSRMPDALLMAGLLAVAWSLRAWVETQRWPWLVVAAAATAVNVNMRSEALVFTWLAAAVAGLVVLFRRSRLAKRAAVFFAVLALAAVAGILPWTIHTYRTNGTPLVTATNGAHVFWVSLGQLPNNPWHRVCADWFGGQFAREHGVSDPFSIAGSDLMWPAFLGDVKAHPFAYVEKVAWNAKTAVLGGIRPTSSFWAPHVEGKSKSRLVRAAVTGHGYSLAWVVGTALWDLFRVVFVLLCGFVLLAAVRAWRADALRPENRLLTVVCASYMVFQFAMVSFGLYLVRFMSPLYALQAMTFVQLSATERPEALYGARAVAFARALLERGASR